MRSLQISRGRSLPLGASGAPEGVNFVVQSRHATAVILVLYELDGGQVPDAEIVLDSRKNRTGPFAGLVEKIPYLKSLGVTAVELLPIHEFDEQDCPFFDPSTGEKLRNFWGYNSIAFAAPKAAYAASGPANGQVIEFREMVRE